LRDSRFGRLIPLMTNDNIPSGPRPPYLTLAAFAVAMAYLESAVVVYLRALFHPDGFHFPLEPIDPHFAGTELGREVATVVMIAAVARLSCGGLRTQLAAFIYVFGIWDLAYYAWLKVLIDWPQTLFDPDILFLIPAPWVGPVLAPALVSVFLVALAFVLCPIRPGPAPRPRVGWPEWGLLFGGGALVLWTFLAPNFFTAGMDKPVVYPERYDWKLFGMGLTAGCWALARLGFKSRRSASPPTLIIPSS
jgi:hypothetical protein